MMKNYFLGVIFLALILLTGCGGGGNGGVEWYVGSMHLGFDAAAAVWYPSTNKLEINFINAAGIPTAKIVIDNVSTVTLNHNYNATVTVDISNSPKESYTGTNTASVYFTTWDLKNGGSLAGSISGTVKRNESPNNVVAIASTWGNTPIHTP
jgi:hypothetical protein